MTAYELSLSLFHTHKTTKRKREKSVTENDDDVIDTGDVISDSDVISEILWNFYYLLS